MKNNNFDFLPDFSKSRPNHILNIVFDADLRCSHDGLAIQAKKLKVGVNKLEVGEFVVFINSSKSMIKMYAAGNTIAHFRMPGKRQFNLKVLKLIPRFFNGRQLDYDSALEEVIRKEIRA